MDCKYLGLICHKKLDRNRKKENKIRKCSTVSRSNIFLKMGLFFFCTRRYEEVQFRHSVNDVLPLLKRATFPQFLMLYILTFPHCLCFIVIPLSITV